MIRCFGKPAPPATLVVHHLGREQAREISLKREALALIDGSKNLANSDILEAVEEQWRIK